MKVLKKSSVVFAMIMVLILNIMNVSAAELPKEAVYDLEKGGTQQFVLQDEDGKITEVVIEEVHIRIKCCKNPEIQIS